MYSPWASLNIFLHMQMLSSQNGKPDLSAKIRDRMDQVVVQAYVLGNIPKQAACTAFQVSSASMASEVSMDGAGR